DSAPGVSSEHLPRLFDRFYRVEASRNRASGGAGLGLAISRRIVEAHHG
ncbi:MAG TPA: signal transduction histidine-protein kinase BaeS, partial [Comamonadaceae bacterium]|nr:signal transduction histidine-protein kinase BaeS [Comamonadaceae bacterium]